MPSLDAVAASSHELVGVVTRPDAPVGPRPAARGLARAAPRRGARRAGADPDARQGPRLPRGPARRSRRTRAPSWPTATSSRRTRSTIPRLGWINLHFSLLPAWRGAAPVQHAIMAGDEVTGASTFVIERGLDTGPVLGVMTETIRPTDTAGDLLDRLSGAGAGLLVATLDGLESGDLVARAAAVRGRLARAQDRGRRRPHRVDAARRPRSTGSCAAARRRPVRGPRSAASDSRSSPVTLVAAPARSRPLGEPLGAGDARSSRRRPSSSAPARVPVRLGTVQAHGKKPMAAADWARGTRIEAGERVGDE